MGKVGVKHALVTFLIVSAKAGMAIMPRNFFLSGRWTFKHIKLLPESLRISLAPPHTLFNLTVNKTHTHPWGGLVSEIHIPREVW